MWSRRPLDIGADRPRRPYEQQRAERGRDRRRQQGIAHGIGAVVVLQRVIDHADASGPTPWPKQVAVSAMIAEASARMLGRATVCAIAKIGPR